MKGKEPYEEILEKYEINSLEKFNRLFESKDPLDRYIASIQREPTGSIIDVYTLESYKDDIGDDIQANYLWILPLKQSAEFVRVCPEKKGYHINKECQPEVYKFLKEEGLID